MLLQILLELAPRCFKSGLSLCTLVILLVSPAQAASVWKLSKGGQHFYLAGTVHILARSDYPLPAAFDYAFKQADEVWFEADLDDFAQAMQQSENRSKVFYTAPANLRQALKPTSYQQLERYCRFYGFDVSILNPLKPAFASTSLMLLRLQQLGVDSPGVDAYYYQQAKRAHKRLRFFESSAEQLTFLSLLEQGPGGGDALILQALADLALLEQDMRKLRQAWRDGDLDALEALQLKPLQQLNPRIYRYLIKQRNLDWLPRLERLQQNDGTELVLVGVLHLLGEDGLLAKLQAKGYQIQQLE